MNTATKLGTFEAIAFIIIVIINKIILNTPKQIIETTGTGAWINIIIISVLACLFVLFICKLFEKFPGKDIIDVSHFLGGKVLKIFTSIIYLLLFLSVTSIVLRNFSNALQAIFLNISPLPYIVMFFIIGIVCVNRLGFGAITKINMVITAAVLISVIIIFVFPLESYVLSNLRPILGYGINKTFLSGLTNVFAYSGIIYIFFLLPFLKKLQDFKKIAITSMIISSIFLFLSIVSLLSLFSYTINSEDMLSILLVTRIINFGNFFQRLDALFVFLWILAFLSYLSILTFFSLNAFKKLTNLSNYKGMIYCFASIIFALALLPNDINQVTFIENYVLKYTVIATSFIFPISIMILANLKLKLKKGT